MDGLEVRGLTVPGRFAGSFSVPAGTVFAVVGPSGSGKSTLLEAVAGVTRASGSVALGGLELSGLTIQRRPAGFVTQAPIVFPKLTVAENVGFALDDARMDPAIRTTKIKLALAQMRISGLADRMPEELSGGQRQRVALARALAQEPQILLLDEPLAHVDPHLRPDLQEVIVSYARRGDACVIYVTHDIDEAFNVGDQVGIMEHGHLEQVDEPRRLYQQPATRHVANTLGINNIFSAYVKAQGLHESHVQIGDLLLYARGGAEPGPALVCFPPESVELENDPSSGALGKRPDGAPSKGPEGASGAPDALVPSKADGAPSEADALAPTMAGVILRAKFLRSRMAYTVETEIGALYASAPISAQQFAPGSHVRVTIKDPWVIPGGANWQ